jgi:hypothetical protein
LDRLAMLSSTLLTIHTVHQTATSGVGSRRATARQTSLTIRSGRTRFRNGTNHAPIAQPVSKR